MSKKIVVKLNVHDGKDKQKALKAVSALAGIDAISVDMASQKMTVIGMVDPVKVMSKLRKASCAATFDSVGPAKEPEKKEEKKPEEKKDEKKEEKKDEKKEGEGEKKDGDGAKKEGEEKKEEKKEGDAAKKDGEEAKKPEPKTEQQILAEPMNQYGLYRGYHPYYMPPPPHYYVQSMEENPNSCVIC